MALKIIGEVALDGSGFERGIARLGDSVKNLVVAGFGIYGIGEAFHKTMERADELTTASQRLGVGIEELQVLQKAAKDSGTELGTIAKAFEKIDQAKAKALSGTKEGNAILAKFGQVGITKDDLQSQSASQLFEGKISKAASTLDQGSLGPVLKDILGKGFGEVLPALQTDFKDLEKKMRETGAIMEAEVAAKLDAIGDEFSIVSMIITSQLAPALLKFVEVMYTSALNVGKEISGLFAAYGAGTSKMGGLRAGLTTVAGIALDNATNPLRLLFGNGAVDRGNLNIMKALGVDVEAAKQAKTEAEKPWEKQIDQFQKMLDAAAENAKNRHRPKVTQNEESPETKEKKFHSESDQLIKVGNFLGSSRSILEDIGNKQVVLLQQIATNTTPKSSLPFGSMDSDYF